MVTKREEDRPSLGLLGTEDVIAWHLLCRTPLYIHFVPGGVEFYDVNPQFFPLGDMLDRCSHCGQLLLAKDIGSPQTFADRMEVMVGSLVNHEAESLCSRLVEEILSISSYAGVPRYYVDTLRSSYFLLIRAAQDFEHAYQRVLSQAVMKTEVHRAQRSRFSHI